MSAFLRILVGNDPQEIPLRNGRYTIGRGDEAGIQICSKQISRLHADLVIENDRVLILDRGSANGTAVNGRFITSSPLHSGDQVLLGDIVVEYVDPNPPLHSPIRSVQRESRTNVIAATKVIADKIRPRSLWPLFAGILVFCFLGLSLLASVSYERVIVQKLKAAHLQRAHDLVRYLAEKNKDEVNSENELLLDIDTVKKEKGVVEAFLLDERGKVLSPIQYRNRLDSDPLVHEALNQNSNHKILPSPVSANGTYTLTHPIRRFNTKTGAYDTVGVAKIIYAPEQVIEALPELNQLKGFLLGAAFALSILLAWLFSKILSSPIARLAEQIHRWRSGQGFTKEDTPFKDWAPLYEAVDLTIEDAGKN